MAYSTQQGHDWQSKWTARKIALESILGPADETLLHAVRPFFLGGAADVLYFRKHVLGRVAATCELLGEKAQLVSRLGTYELMIAQRDEDSWGPKLIAKLARYTCESRLEAGHTMEIGPLCPSGSTITGLLFDEYASLMFEGQPAGLLLCIGITAGELEACRAAKKREVLEALKSADVYPYTDLFRPSVL